MRARDIWKWRKDLREQLQDYLGYAPSLREDSLPSVDAFLSSPVGASPESEGEWEALPDIYTEADLELYRALGDGAAHRNDYLQVRGAALSEKDFALETGKLETVPYGDLRIAYLWKVIRRRVRMEDPPGPEVVANLVMLGPIPLDMRRFVADMLCGKVKQRRGRKKGQRAHEPSRAVAHRVFRWKRVFERTKQRTGRSCDPYREALAKVADETSIPEATLDKWCYPRDT